MHSHQKIERSSTSSPIKVELVLCSMVMHGHSSEGDDYEDLGTAEEWIIEDYGTSSQQHILFWL